MRPVLTANVKSMGTTTLAASSRSARARAFSPPRAPRLTISLTERAAVHTSFDSSSLWRRAGPEGRPPPPDPPELPRRPPAEALGFDDLGRDRDHQRPADAADPPSR